MPKTRKPKTKTRTKPSRSKKQPPPPATKEPPTESSLICFWTPHQPHGIFSQWYPSTFTVPATAFSTFLAQSPTTNTTTITFNCAEQFMMYCKALHFSDAASAASILAAPDPQTQKALGRQVANFDDERWKEVREKIVEEASWYKFTVDEALRKGLLETGVRELVEASPRDRIWGIGFGARNAEASRARWGLNLLGKALMKVRGRIAEGEKVEAARGEGGKEEGAQEEEGEEVPSETA
ncbi:MAG: hypothetical protein M1834_004792 [Cirrosporium novae-zelandiae]|nr:MAG: hypothetical protein M1834_004792 [Cirrosporium novae-zelandiae]